MKEPSKAAVGTKNLWSAPIESLTIWGATKPMKPIIPEIHTAAPVAQQARIITRRLLDSTRTPI